MASERIFYAVILFYALLTASAAQAGDERDLALQKTMDCAQEHLHQNGSIGWDEICYYESVSNQHMQIVSQQMDQVENNASLPLIPEPSAQQPSDQSLNKHRTEKFNRSGFYATTAYEMNHMHYSEWMDHEKLDEDYGKQNGMYYAMGYRGPKPLNIKDLFMGKPFIEAYYYKSNANSIHYKGALQDGTPYDVEENSRIYKRGLKLGGYGNFSDKGEAYGYVDFGKRIWYRGQDEGYNYREKYYWYYGGLGAGFSYPLIPRLLMGLEGEILFASNPRMYADNINSDFKLGSTWEAVLKIPIKYFILRNLSLDVTPYFNYLRIGQSKFVPDGNTGYGYIEPDSKTHNEGLLAGMTLYM